VRSAVQKHVRDHLKDLVEMDAFERDGKLWFKGYREREFVRGKRDSLYVCKRTGLLRVLPALPRKLRAERQSPVTWVRPGHAAFVFRDQWWRVQVARFKAFPVRDVLLQTELHGSEKYGSGIAAHLYGNGWVRGVSRQALTRAEVAQLGLKRT